MPSRAQHTHSLSLLPPAASPVIFPPAGARHLAVDRPSRASNDQISPTTVIPYHRSYLATILSSQNRTTCEEPPSGSPTTGSHRRGPPPDAVTPPLAGAWARAHGAYPCCSALPWAGWAACPRSLGRNLPPVQLPENSFSFSFFHFFFLFSYIYAYIDILCTKNSLNKL